jgi:hypothetical protein
LLHWLQPNERAFEARQPLFVFRRSVIEKDLP